MLTVISPAKNMKLRPQATPPRTLPRFTEEASEIFGVLKNYSPWDLQNLMSLNESLAADSADRNRAVRFGMDGSSALELYDGIQYKYLNPHNFTDAQKDFAQEHLRILSGAYGVLRPYDSICEYRLEMLTKLPVAGCQNLYDYWGDKLCEELYQHTSTVINLASGEYSKCIRKFLPKTSSRRLLTCHFQVYRRGSYKTTAIMAKIARGLMAGYLIRNRVDKPEGLCFFEEDGYRFEPSLSTETEYLFRQQI